MSRFVTNKRPIVEINKNLYIVHAEYPMNKIKDTNLVRDWLGVEHVFKSHRDGTYIFCELIEEPEWKDIT